jgi:hypothetical protein
MRARLTVAFTAILLTPLAPRTAPAQTPQSTAAGRGAPAPRDDEPKMLVGTWRLNTAKSKYSPGPPIKAETRVYTRGPQGVEGVVVRTYADGRMERFEYIANFGREYMVTGNPEYDAVVLRRVDEYASEAVLTHAGSVYGVARRTISPDGKSMMITFDRKNADTPVHNVAVYDKQP